MTLRQAAAVVGILGVLGGCTPREAAPVPGGQGYEVALPVGCRPRPALDGTSFCDFGIGDRPLRIAFVGYQGPPELIAGMAIPPDGNRREQLRKLLRRFYDDYLRGVGAAGPGARVTRSTASFDAVQAASGGFDACLRYARGLDMGRSVTDEDGVICVTYLADSETIELTQVAYVEARPRARPTAETFHREADHVIRSLRRSG